MEYQFIGMLIVSVLLIYFAIKQYTKSKNLLLHGIKTKGTVVGLIEVKDRDNGNSSYKPIFQYKDTTHTLVTFESVVSTHPPAYDVGDKVDIVYSKDNEERKVISFWGLYIWVVVLLILATILGIVGSVGLFI